jgi:hypothetical protein
VDGLLGTLERLRWDEVAVEEATDADLQRFGLRQPARTVVLGLGATARQTLEIGTGPEAGKLYAREANRRLVGVIADTAVSELTKGMADLRAKRLLDVATYDVAGLDVVSEGVLQRYSRAPQGDDADATGRWTREPGGDEISTDAIQDALFKIGGVEAEAFVDAPGPLADYGLDAPALRVVLRYEGERPERWIEIGSRDGAYYGRRVDDESVLRLQRAKAEELLEAFRAIGSSDATE